MGSKPFSIDDQGRRAERIALDEAARLRPNSWSSLEIRVLDLSPLGFRGACDARLQRGGTVAIEIPGLGSIEAQVEWQRGGEFGARFFTAIAIEGCAWPLDAQNHALAQLLVERAGARRAGRYGSDRQLRRQILGALPVRKGSASA